MTIPKDAQVGTTLYRARTYFVGLQVRLDYREFEVTKVTPKGAWVVYKEDAHALRFWQEGYCSDPRADPGIRPKWYPFQCKFLSATKEEALVGLKRRKALHWQHAYRRLKMVEEILMFLEMPIPRQQQDWLGQALNEGNGEYKP